MATQVDKAKQKANYEAHTMTVSELYEAFGKLIEDGDGDAMIDVDDNCGGSYALPKFNHGTAPLTVHKSELGKWVFLGQ